MFDDRDPKPLVWIGSSRKDFRGFPDEVKSEMGYGLFQAQLGGRHRGAKTLAGFGGAVLLRLPMITGAAHTA